MQIRLLILVVMLSACSEDERAPITPGGGPGEDVGETPNDGGGNVDDEDAGSTSDAGMGDGPMPGECVRIDPVMIGSSEIATVTSTTTPADFKVTRQVGTWSGDCPFPSVVVELSNGICPNGQGHELEFWLPASGIADGTIALGYNMIDADASNGIGIRYTRPKGISAAGIYGTCAGVSGVISFYDAPDVTRAMNLRAKYDLMLPPCDDTKSNPMQMVSGYFDVRVRRTLAVVCPP